MTSYRSIAADGAVPDASHYGRARAGARAADAATRVRDLRDRHGDFEVGGLASQKVLKGVSTRTAEIARSLAHQVGRSGRATGMTRPRACSGRWRDATMKDAPAEGHARDRARQLAAWDAKYRVRRCGRWTRSRGPRGSTRSVCTDWTVNGAATGCTAPRWRGRPCSSSADNVEVGAPGAGDPENGGRHAAGGCPAGGVDGLVLCIVREALTGGEVVLLEPFRRR